MATTENKTVWEVEGDGSVESPGIGSSNELDWKTDRSVNGEVLGFGLIWVGKRKTSRGE